MRTFFFFYNVWLKNRTINIFASTSYNKIYAIEKKIEPIWSLFKKIPFFPDVKRKLFKIEFYLLYIFKRNILEKEDKDNEKKITFFFKSRFPNQNEIQNFFRQKKK